ncbi:MAG: isoleucine--tRNA ligase [Alphaproteobacteria bacterium]
MSVDFKDTVFLPKTPFSMRANLANKEPEILKKWQQIGLYQKMRQAREGCEPFILHDGPPYANGPIHIGTGLNKILKDIVNRSQHMLGKQINYIPGWDCHGLPIEWKIEEKYRKAGKSKEDVPMIEFRQECRDFATHWVGVQREEFQRLGVMADWDNPYMTMSHKAEATIVRELGKFLMNGSLVLGEKPVMWSVVEQTALAEAEVEYKDHESPSLYIKFPVARSPVNALEGAFAVIWTTTAWTIPANQLIAFSETIDYVLLQIDEVGSESIAQVGDKILVAEELCEGILQAAKIVRHTVVEKFSGKQLAGTVCQHPLHASGYDHDVPLHPGDHVTTEAGTGLVHCATGHGVDDFYLGQKHGIHPPKTVDAKGVYYDSVPLFAGTHIFKVTQPVIDALQESGNLLNAGRITHSYPCSWRSKAPLIYRTTPQWFISMENNDLRKKALKEIELVRWVPASGQRRIDSMVRDRPDWCISRQRAWGTPLPIFLNKETGEPLRDEKVMQRIVDAVAEEGTDTWFTSKPERFLAPEYNPEDFTQVTDIVDVWFDAGSSHVFVLEETEGLTWPADLYLEGSDQHRGWFQTSLLEACGTRGASPYKTVLTHGYVLDDQGRKMSKSLGNVVSPIEVANEMGIEMLRLWVSSSDFTQDVRIAKERLDYQKDTYRRFRNTLRYLLGGLSDFTEAERVENTADMPELEQWVLHRLAALDQMMRGCLDDYNFQQWFAELHRFCSVDLSAFYFDIRKDVLYCDAPDDMTRRSMRTVFDHVFKALTKWIAPVLCFTADEAWTNRYGEEASNIHLETFPEITSGWLNNDLDQRIETIRKYRQVMTTALERARKDDMIRSSLQATLQVFDPKGVIPRDLKWDDIAITSGVAFMEKDIPADAYADEEIGVIVAVASGDKCQRCWKILDEVGSNAENWEVCGRCAGVVSATSQAQQTG